MMNEDQGIKFTSKAEIADCIRALTPFTMTKSQNPDENKWALDKIKELTKLI